MNKLKKELIAIGNAISSSYSLNMDIYSLYVEDKAELIEYEWNNFKAKYPNLYSFDLKDVKYWSTYEKCVSSIFYVENDELFVKVRVYKGDRLDGFPTELRFKATFKIPMDFLNNISHIIERQFHNYVDELYEIHLEDQRKQCINNYKNSFMKKVKTLKIPINQEKIMGKIARAQYLEDNPHGFKRTKKVHKNKKKYTRKGKNKSRDFGSFFLPEILFYSSL